MPIPVAARSCFLLCDTENRGFREAVGQEESCRMMPSLSCSGVTVCQLLTMPMRKVSWQSWHGIPRHSRCPCRAVRRYSRRSGRGRWCSALPVVLCQRACIPDSGTSTVLRCTGVLCPLPIQRVTWYVRHTRLYSRPVLPSPPPDAVRIRGRFDGSRTA